MKKVLITIAIIMIILLGKGLQKIDEIERDKALERCNNNIEEHYTKDGDIYFSCKIEKEN